MPRHPTVRATFYEGDTPIEVEAEVYPGCPGCFDFRFGNWLPGDYPELYDLRRVDGEPLPPSQRAEAEAAIWEADATLAEKERE